VNQPSPTRQAHGLPPRRTADVFKEGFARGALDALRRAARALGPEAWAVLEGLASEYDLAGSDG
jgi:hypothetical protein